MADDERLEQIIETWYEQVERGKRVDPEEFIAKHPEFADELRKRLDAQRLLDATYSTPDVPGGTPREIGDYRIVREIGRGGMGVVYEAEQVSMHRKVALKVLSLAFTNTTQAIKRFQQEARAAGRLHHTNIVPVYAMDQHAGYWYYAMELVHGRPLSAVIAGLRKGEPSGEREAAQTPTDRRLATGTGDRAYYVRMAEMFAGVAEALQLTHSEGIIHRDVKPSNLLLDDDGVLKIVDFGLARFDGTEASMTMTGDLLGTPVYMSPEQAMAKRIKIDFRTDIYSLGATLYEVLTLKQPFEGETLHELCSQIITKDPALPRRANPRVPRDLETIVLKAMEKDRDKRYASAGELAKDLRRFADGAAIHARRIGPVERAWRRVRRDKVRSALVAGVLLAVGAAVLLALQTAKDARLLLVREYEELCAQADREAAGRRGHCAKEVHGPEAIYSEAIDLLPERYEAWLGRATAGTGGLDKRLADLHEARKCGLSSRIYHLARATLLAERRLWEKAEEAEAEAKDAEDRSPEAIFFEAVLRDSFGGRTQAMRMLDDLLDGRPLDDTLRQRAHAHRAELHRQALDFDGRLEDLQAVRALGDDSIKVRAQIAAAVQRLGVEGAERRFEEVLAQVRVADTVAAWVELCEGFHTYPPWHDRAVAEASEEYGDALDIVKERLLVLERHDKKQMLALAQQALEDYPDSATVFMYLGYAWSVNGDPQRALAAYDKSVALDGDKWCTHRNRAVALWKLGRNDQAVAATDRAIDLHRGQTVLFVNRAVQLSSAGRYEEALEGFGDVLRLRKNSMFALNQRGSMLSNKLGRHEEALKDFTRAIGIRPKKAAGAYFNRAIVYGRLGMLEESAADFRAVIERRPKHEKAHLALVRVLTRLERRDEAIEVARQALARGMHYYAALSFQHLGLADDARAAFLRSDLEDAGTALDYALFLGECGEHEEELAIYERHLPHVKRPKLRVKFLSNRGNVLRILKEYPASLESFRECLEVNPGWADGYANRALTWAALGNDERAVQDLRKYTQLRPDDEPGKAALKKALERLKQE